MNMSENINKEILEVLNMTSEKTDKGSFGVWEKFDSIIFTKDGVKFMPKVEDDQTDKAEDDKNENAMPKEEPKPSNVEKDIADLKAAVAELAKKVEGIMNEKAPEAPKKEEKKPEEIDNSNDAPESKIDNGKDEKSESENFNSNTIGLKEIGKIISIGRKK